MNPNLLILKKWYFRFLSKRKTTRENFKLSLNTTYFLYIILIWVLSLYYVWTINANATKWYNIKKLELTNKNLTLEKEILDIKIAQTVSLTNLLDSPQAKKMEVVEANNYLVINDDVNYAFNN